MNRKKEYISMIQEMDKLVPDLETTLNRAIKKKEKKDKRIRLFATVTIAFFLLVSTTSEHSTENPLVITVQAVSNDGKSITTNLSLGEQVQLSPVEFYYDGSLACYTFDLSLVEGMYLQLSAVDENWELILDKEVHSSGETTTPPYWALTDGDDIAIVSTDLEGNVFQSYKDGVEYPRFKGSSMIWRPNDDGANRCIIDCFDEQFNRVVSYFLEITQVDGVYYAEIVKIT